MRMRAASAALLASVLLCSCIFDTMTQKLVGPYRLVAIDSTDQTRLCWSDQCPIEPMVTDAGFDDRFVVARVDRSGDTFRPPYKPWFTPAFYYIERRADEAEKVTEAAIHGPLTEAEYAEAKARLKLPEFSRHVR